MRDLVARAAGASPFTLRAAAPVELVVLADVSVLALPVRLPGILHPGSLTKIIRERAIQNTV